MSPILQTKANGSAFGYGMFVPSGSGTAYESIATAAGTGSGLEVVLSSIPSNYQHLQLRVMYTSNNSGSPLLRFNSDSGTNYSSHSIMGDGTTTIVSANASVSSIALVSNSYSIDSQGRPVLYIIDIHNYASTSQYKTVRIFGGQDPNANPRRCFLGSGLWMSTSAINSITFRPVVAMSTSSYVALYGIKGA